MSKQGKAKAEVEVIDEYRPNYARRCMVCSARPVVEGWKDEKVVYRGDMCGPCTFGTGRAVDPAWWNSEDA